MSPKTEKLSFYCSRFWERLYTYEVIYTLHSTDQLTSQTENGIGYQCFDLQYTLINGC